MQRLKVMGGAELRYWLLAVGFWLLAISYWLLAVSGYGGSGAAGMMVLFSNKLYNAVNTNRSSRNRINKHIGWMHIL